MPRAETSQRTTPHNPNLTSSARGPGDGSRRDKGRKPETISSAPYEMPPPPPQRPAARGNKDANTQKATVKRLLYICCHARRAIRQSSAGAETDTRPRLPGAERQGENMQTTPFVVHVLVSTSFSSPHDEKKRHSFVSTNCPLFEH